MSGFVYLWYDRKHKRFYIGSHWGPEDDGYICSSRWMRNAYRRRSNDFKRKIIERVSSRETLYIAEQRWLSMIANNELGIRYYNLRKVVGGNWLQLSDPSYKKSIGEKISIAKKNKPVSEDHKKKISQTLKGRPLSEETKKKMSLARQGKKRVPASAETKRKISQTLKGRPLSEETKKKMSLAWERRRKNENHRI